MTPDIFHDLPDRRQITAVVLFNQRMPAQDNKCNRQFDGPKCKQCRQSRDVGDIVSVGRMQLPHDRQMDRTLFQPPQFMQGRSGSGLRVYRKVRSRSIVRSRLRVHA